MGTLLGNKPRPIRKRGYYRALSRKEPWALMEQAMRVVTNRIVENMLKPSPFLKMNEMSGLIPVIYRKTR